MYVKASVQGAGNESFAPSDDGSAKYGEPLVPILSDDGIIQYCGRAGRQVKHLGQCIALGEIEDTVAKYSAVNRAAVVIRAIQDTPAIVAFVEMRGVAAEQLEEEEALKVFVAEHLPRFMCPSLISVLSRLPLSHSGKIDRNALQQMDLKTRTPDLNTNTGTPSGDIEVELTNIFNKALNVDSGIFDVNYDLFALGLDSVIAVQSASVISKTFNVHIGLNTIYLGPTIRELGTLIIDAMDRDSRAIMEAEDTDTDFLIELLPIKKKGAQPRIFIVHDITGMATPFKRLDAFMPNELYAIGDKHFGSENGFGSIEAMAEHYVSLTKSVQPEGPYVIAGYSYGGLVALCMASTLAKRGEEVAHLILFDPIYIPPTERQGLKSIDWTHRAIYRITSNFPDMSEKWKNKLRVEICKNVESMFNYEADFYDGLTTLVVPIDRSWHRSGPASDLSTGADDHNGWDARIKNLDMKTSAGSHHTMFTPAHIKVLAGVMKEILAVPGTGAVCRYRTLVETAADITFCTWI
ncbi:hypothetical protein ID866_8198 [Astraeus odoratus]|nr:hypothetical protein ID866_8198 [Astraeus odoratus]